MSLFFKENMEYQLFNYILFIRYSRQYNVFLRDLFYKFLHLRIAFINKQNILSCYDYRNTFIFDFEKNVLGSCTLFLRYNFIVNLDEYVSNYQIKQRSLYLFTILNIAGHYVYTFDITQVYLCFIALFRCFFFLGESNLSLMSLSDKRYNYFCNSSNFLLLRYVINTIKILESLLAGISFETFVYNDNILSKCSGLFLFNYTKKPFLDFVLKFNLFTVGVLVDFQLIEYYDIFLPIPVVTNEIAFFFFEFLLYAYKLGYSSYIDKCYFEFGGCYKHMYKVYLE
jgi:hypothetical protein